MASKIPVGGTVARAYRFAFANIVNNLGAIWLPVAILWTASYFFYAPYSRAMTEITSGDPAALMRSGPFWLAAFVITFVLATAQMAALTREALGLRAGNAFLQFPFGAPMWRLLGAYIVFFLALIAIYIAVLLIAFVAAFALGILAKAVGGRAMTVVIGLGAAIGVIATLCLMLYSAVRLSFLLAPIAVAEGRITLTRGWLLARGNFWRMFAVLLAVLIPLLLIEFAYLYGLYGKNLFPSAGLAGSAATIGAWHRQQQQSTLALMTWSRSHWYIVYPAGLLFASILYGLLAGISVFAYRALAAEPTPETPL